MQEVKSAVIESWMNLTELYPSENKISWDELDDLYDLRVGFKRFSVGDKSTWYTRGFAFTYHADLADSCLWFDRTGHENEIRINCGKDYALITLDDHYPVLAEKAPDLIIAELKAENESLRAQLNKIREVLEIE